MIFKKKYKRSSWMEGLLWAEEHTKIGRDVGYYKTQHPEPFTRYWVKSDDTQINNTYRFPINSDDFIRGLEDYLNYFEENKEILSKGLDG